MEPEPTPWLAYRAFADLALWAIVIILLLIYLWALASGPVSAADPAPATSPVPAQKQLPPPGGGRPVA